MAGELKRIEREAQIKADYIRTNPLGEILTGKETLDELKEIARLKKYHPRWAEHQLGRRRPQPHQELAHA